LILPISNFIALGINTTVDNLKLLKPTKIICENDEIFRIISPYFKEETVVMNYSDGVEYCGSPIKNKINYAFISAYFLLIIYSLILDNFILAFFLTLIFLLVFSGIILWFSEREEWEAGGKRIIHA
jgi:hypothetical protein